MGGGDLQVGAAQLALRALHAELEGEIVLVVPSGIRQCIEGRIQVPARGFVGRRGLRPASRLEVDPGRPLALRRAGQERQAHVDLVGDGQDALDGLVGPQPPEQQAADAQVPARSHGLRDEAVGGLPHPVVEEAIVTVVGDQHARGDGRAQPRVHGLRAAQQGGQRLVVGAASEAGQDPECALRLRREAREPPCHQSDDVVGGVLARDACAIPLPCAVFRIEAQQAFFLQAGEELASEERIARRLAMDELAERSCRLAGHVQRVADDARDVVARDRLETQVVDLPAGRPYRRQRARQRVILGHLVVAIRAHQQQVMRVRMCREEFDERKRPRVQPLEVVQEEDQRAIGACEDCGEPQEDRLEADRGLVRRDHGHRSLRADQRQQLGNEFDQQDAARAERLADRRAPAGDRGLVLVQEARDEFLEGMRDRGMGNVLESLVELAGDEEAAGWRQALAQFVDEGRLADPRVAGHQHHPGVAAREDARIVILQDRDLLLAAMDLLGQGEAPGHVLRSDREGLDPMPGLPIGEAPVQVRRHAQCRLVPIFGGLRKKLQDQGGQHVGHVRLPLGRWQRRPRDVGMDPFEGIRRAERRGAGQQLVEHDSERIQVASRVDRSIHVPRLFGCHVGPGADDHLLLVVALARLRLGAGDGEAG